MPFTHINSSYSSPRNPMPRNGIKVIKVILRLLAPPKLLGDILALEDLRIKVLIFVTAFQVPDLFHRQLVHVLVALLLWLLDRMGNLFGVFTHYIYLSMSGNLFGLIFRPLGIPSDERRESSWHRDSPRYCVTSFRQNSLDKASLHVDAVIQSNSLELWLIFS